MDRSNDTNKLLTQIVGHEGWEEVRKKVIDAIIELQDLNAIDISNEANVIIDVKSRKLAAQTLWRIFSDIEGTAKMFPNTKEVIEKTYLFRL